MSASHKPQVVEWSSPCMFDICLKFMCGDLLRMSVRLHQPSCVGKVLRMSVRLHQPSCVGKVLWSMGVLLLTAVCWLHLLPSSHRGAQKGLSNMPPSSAVSCFVSVGTFLLWLAERRYIILLDGQWNVYVNIASFHSLPIAVFCFFLKVLTACESFFFPYIWFFHQPQLWVL